MSVVSDPPTSSSTITSTSEPKFKATFDTKPPFQMDPFSDEDPFDRVDPFAEEEYRPQPIDPFNTDFIVNFKMYNKHNDLKPVQNNQKQVPEPELIDSLKFPPVESILEDSSTDRNYQPLYHSALTKSPNKYSSSPSSKSLFSKQHHHTFDYKFDFPDKRKDLSLLHENPSLDLSSESESTAPEPPPRPSNVTPVIKPPPLPPKKQQNDMSMKPPPRPPHSDLDLHYDYIDSGPNSLDSLDKSPPIPVPVRKSHKLEWESNLVPQRPRKTFGSTLSSSQEDYLTPITSVNNTQVCHIVTFFYY